MENFIIFIILTLVTINLYSDYKNLFKENDKLRNDISKKDFLELENSQLRKLINEQVASSSNLVSARVMLDEQSPYLNSFVTNVHLYLHGRIKKPSKIRVF